MTDMPETTRPPARRRLFLGRLGAAIRRQDWFAVALEVLIVVAGVLIALAVNDWAAARQAREVEIQSLRELRTALQHDLEDVRVNLQIHREASASTAALLAHLDAGLPYADSLDAYFGRVPAPTFSIRDRAAYETLQQRGLGTITDDSLRLAIGHLYGVRYEAVSGVQANASAFTFDKLLDYMYDHFSGTFLQGPLRPDEYDALMRSRRFRSIAGLAALSGTVLARQYEQTEREIVDLIAALDAEIARREGAR